MRIAAVDLETANRHRHSACQVAVVLLEDGRIVDAVADVLDPEGPFEALHMALHGITPELIEGAPRLVDLWPRLSALLAPADRVVAHNAAFDRSVLEKTLAMQGVEAPALRWECSVVRARRLLPHLPNHRLPTVCAALGITLENHHDAVCDALAAARVALALDAIERHTPRACPAPGVEPLPLAA
jgi:DNA polymerase-3 subunit epsilon